MGAFARLAGRAARLWTGHSLALWFHPAYRLPFASIEAMTGLEPRRADLVFGYLVDRGVVDERDVRRPHRARYEDIARVHTAEWLESLHDPATLGRVFAVDASDIVVDEVLYTIRVACGGTLEAARHALARRGPALNLLGGFHHAGPDRGAGFCAINDIAIAVAALRAEGFDKRVVVLDLDAHPPDGTAECFPKDPSVWIGSLSGTNWGQLPSVDETALPGDCDDASYVAALTALLERMPSAGLAFVIAGGDVLAGDRLGGLALTLNGARERDRVVWRALGSIPSVWLPGGGYSAQAWRALAGSALVLAGRGQEPIAAEADPLRAGYATIADQLEREDLAGRFSLTEADIMASLAPRSAKSVRLLDFYTREGLEFALSRYGILEVLRRLGYSRFRVDIDREETGDRMRLFAHAGGREHLLIEVVLERRKIGDDDVLYVHWLTLRNPRGQFSGSRPRLPGQEEPGLGMAREAGLLLSKTAERLQLAGIAFRPAWMHTAYAARSAMRFVDPARQGRFEAMLRDLAHVPLLEVTLAVSEGRVTLNGQRYTWEADEMVHWLDGRPADTEAIARERERVRFAIERERPSQSA